MEYIVIFDWNGRTRSAVREAPYPDDAWIRVLQDFPGAVLHYIAR